MLRFLVAGLAASTVMGSAYAAELDFASSIDAVTVFPQTAQVTRLADGAVPMGDHVIIIDDLPGDVDPATIRVKGVGNGVEINAVDIRRVPVFRDNDPQERQRLEAELKASNDAITLLDAQRNDLQAKRDLLKELVTNAVSSPGEGEVAMAPDAVMAMFDATSERLEALTMRKSELDKQFRELSENHADIERLLHALAPTGETRIEVAVNVTASQETDVELSIQYGVQQASWSAIYHASLDLDEGIEEVAFDVERRAHVVQATTESWDGVALTLSTTRPSASTAPPQLTSHVIGEQQENLESETIDVLRPRANNVLTREQSILSERDVLSAGGVASPRQPAPMRQSALNATGFQASYQIAGRSNISNTGEETSVLIAIDDDLDAELFALSAPVQDPAAYLMVDFRNDVGAPYLPGQIFLTRDGTYLGKAQMPLLASGDTHALGFGVDDKILVERIELDRRRGEEGLISTSNVDEQNHRIEVTNLHDFAIPVRIIDRMPVANHEDIKISLLNDSRPADKTDHYDERGVLAWDLEPEAGETVSYTFGYRINWPEDMELTGRDGLY